MAAQKKYLTKKLTTPLLIIETLFADLPQESRLEISTENPLRKNYKPF